MKLISLLFTVTVFFTCAVSSDVEKAFIDSEIVPDSLSVAPKKIVNVSYPNGVTVNLGNKLTPTQVKDVPEVSWDADQNAYYTLFMVDPDAPSRENPRNREFRHWLVVNIPGNDVQKGDEVIGFIGSGPPKGTGFHRYVYLVYKQPNGIIQHNEPRSTNRSGANRAKTSASEFAQRYNLGAPEFGNFYEAQYDAYVDILNAQLKG
ncbi:protein D1-like isoform X1 [Sitodiplosis mosellana]|uniref:protein D1-like isoform X1 n=1 Tax=Sitodiplosis mosellana TaxID=263140 RepID=UPI0024444FB0|nr:protein D1-like isoform X1 [Sitodiplosis mosellana]